MYVRVCETAFDVPRPGCGRRPDPFRPWRQTLQKASHHHTTRERRVLMRLLRQILREAAKHTGLPGLHRDQGSW